MTYEFRQVGDGGKTAATDLFYKEEIQLALRNRGMPLEGLRYDLTPAGMHYLLIHFDIPETRADGWTLQIGGMVRRPAVLSMDDIMSRPSVTLPVTMECAGNGRALMEPRAVSQPWLLEAIGTAEWTGTPLAPIIREAGVEDGAVELLFTGADEGVQGGELQYYQRSMTLEQAARDEVTLAYAMNGAPLQPQHGSPLRLIAPGWYGMASVKWLTRVEAIGEPFDGYQQTRTYRYAQSADDLGEPVDLIKPRSLMIPPGVPDFLTRTRLIRAGVHTVSGRAWAGRRDITRVEFSADGGATWTDADLSPRVGEYAWRAWSAQWDAKPGEHALTVRATDESGSVQPLEQPWNYQGMGNNMAQRVDVVVVE